MKLKDIQQLVLERKLTAAELNKREEIATAIERENPGIDMSKKMAIATTQAKKVTEDTEQLDEISAYDKVVTYYRHLGLDPYKLRGVVGKQLRAKIKDSPAFKAWLKINQYESVEGNSQSSLLEAIKDAKKAVKSKKVDIIFFGYPDANTANQVANSDINQTQTDSNFLTPN